MSASTHVPDRHYAHFDPGTVLESTERSKSKRNPTIDGLKFIAAASIVLLHVSGAYPAPRGNFLSGFLTSASYGALFFFFAVSGYLHGALGTRGWSWIRTRFVRLGVPYVVWSVVYLIWGLSQGRPLPSWWHIAFFAGANELLWSLPILLLCAVLAESLIRRPIHRRIFIGVFGILAVLTSLYAPVAWYANPIRQFIWGARWPLVYALGMEVRASKGRNLGPVLPIVLLGTIILTGVLGAYDLTPYPLRLYTLTATTLYIFGSVLLLYGAHSGHHWFVADRLAWGGPFLLGIYVSHYLWLEVMLKLLPTTALRMSVWIPVVWAAVFSLALSTTWLLRSFRITRPAVAYPPSATHGEVPSEHCRSETSRWVKFSIAAIVIFALGTVFALPWFMPVARRLVASDSQAVGFSNRTAMIGLALSVCGMFALAWIARRKGATSGNDPLFNFNPAQKQERIPRSWVVIASGSCALAVIALGLFYRRYLPLGEGAYFINAILQITRNGAAFSRVFSYGPLLLFPPVLAGRLMGVHGMGFIYAYYAWTALLFALSPVIYAYILNRLSLSPKARRWTFALLSVHALSIAWYLGAATTAVRCALPYALLLWSLSVALNSKHPVASVGLPAIATLIGYGISPEMGVALVIAFGVALLVRAFYERSRASAWALAAFVAFAAVGFLALTAASGASTIGDFAGGAFYQPVLPSPFTLVYLGAFLLLAYGIGSQLPGPDAKSWALHAGWLALAGVYIAPALGRADWGHVLGNGIGVILAFATVSQTRWRRDTPYLLIAIGIFMVAHFAQFGTLWHRNSIIAYQRGVWSGSITKPRALALARLTGRSSADAASEFDAVSQLGARRRFEIKRLSSLPRLAFLDPFESDIVYELSGTGHLARGYFDPGTALSAGYFDLAVKSLDDADTLAIPTSLYTDYLSAESQAGADTGAEAAPVMMVPRVVMTSQQAEILHGVPIELRGRYPVFSAPASFARLLRRDWKVLRQNEDYVILVRKTGDPR